MTGFFSVEAVEGAATLVLDARSVNNRGLDVRLRLPSGYERQEAPLRRAIGERFKRGSIQVALTVRKEAADTRFSVNQEQLGAYVEAIQALASSGSVAAPRADGLLALRGVIETASEEVDEAVDIAPHVAALLSGLEASRLEEGGRIAPAIAGQLDAMERIAVALDAHPERALPAIKARIDAQLADLLAPDNALSPERLHQEAALLATKSDIREELDRLAAHIAAARALMESGGAVGRKLDFLAQEFNRETNTICAKAPHHALTALGLELKAVVEQMREQVQNLE
ncbi:MAG: YicC/YloC family endoribonuclease [Pseudomonadota bacterium]